MFARNRIITCLRRSCEHSTLEGDQMQWSTQEVTASKVFLGTSIATVLADYCRGMDPCRSQESNDEENYEWAKSAQGLENRLYEVLLWWVDVEYNSNSYVNSIDPLFSQKVWISMHIPFKPTDNFRDHIALPKEVDQSLIKSAVCDMLPSYGLANFDANKLWDVIASPLIVP